MEIQRFIITNEWYDNRDDLKTERFLDFKGAFEKYYSCDDRCDIKLLADKLDNLGILGKNDKIFKIFNYKYKYKHKEKYFTIKDDYYKIDDITGFCDVTDFIKKLRDDDDIDYCCIALKQFMSYGGVVRINDKVFVIDDFEIMRELIKDIVF